MCEKRNPPKKKIKRATHGYIAFQWSQKHKEERAGSSDRNPTQISVLEDRPSLFCSLLLLP